MNQYSTPESTFAELFEAVQIGHVFADSKTFVDAVPKRNPVEILKMYRTCRQDDDFDLANFVTTNFNLPSYQEAELVADKSRPARQHIDMLWDILKRESTTEPAYSSRIALPNPYYVPGGRFREAYYWDSYFTMLGLAEAGRFDAIEEMVENFAFLIDRIGFIPNGNRTYFCTRSQPPFFVLMVELLATVRRDPEIVREYLPQLRREYEFWMRGSDEAHEDGSASGRVIRVRDGYLNRYWDDSETPRAESYAEDRDHAVKSNRDERELFRNIRAACESGWDFSSRWFRDKTFESIRTTAILPVDLNAMMYKLEAVLADSYKSIGEIELGKHFEQRAIYRQEMLRTAFYDDESGFFVDLDITKLEPTGVLSLAAAFPMFLKIASAKQAARFASCVQNLFLGPGGWRTTLQSSGQQWDLPNGWAPLQWIVFTALNNYGFTKEADIGANRWMANNLDVYSLTGRMLEKYDVEHIGDLATGGEYEVQDGFGWTNGILLKFMNHFGEN